MQYQLRTSNKRMTGNREIRNSRWPPAAILNFTKTLITFEQYKTANIKLFCSTKFSYERSYDLALNIKL